ncbi:hypothetical protein AGDE_15149 [Angomonas deanei]|nr:hypothetical protein AGDE_15149 [Angomonas deanei]|eukprot:EPY19619.1 hypothetical protein AGDE_15149 [Angomonas deanei]
MQQRDTIREYISQCHHLAQLFKELKALDSQTSFIAEKSRVEREHEKLKELLAQIAEMEKKDAEWKKEKEKQEK